MAHQKLLILLLISFTFKPFFLHKILLFSSFIHQYSALRPVQQEPEPSQATGMALAHCILGRFLGVGCHCFPPIPFIASFNFVTMILLFHSVQLSQNNSHNCKNILNFRFGYVFNKFLRFCLHECRPEPTQTAKEGQMEVYFFAEKKS